MEKLKINRASNLSKEIFDLFINPLIIGSYGFATLFMVLLAIKALGLYLGNYDKIVVTTNDILLSLWGFIFYFVLRLIANLNRRTKLSRTKNFKLGDKVKNLI